MSEFINTVDSIGDEVLTNSIIDRSITEIRDNYATLIGGNAFGYCSALTTVDFPVVTRIGDYAFVGCSALTAVDFPVVTRIGYKTFASCSALTIVDFPVMTSTGYNAFDSCSALTTVDFPVVTEIGYGVFRDCSVLMALILRSETIATLDSTDAFSGTPIASGTGYIYVPFSLINSYKTASNWSTFAAQFRALEDYTVDGTITGALDESKI